MPPDRRPASIVIAEPEPLSTQLTSEVPILINQIGDHLALLAAQPAVGCSGSLGRDVGQYAIDQNQYC